MVSGIKSYMDYDGLSQIVFSVYQSLLKRHEEFEGLFWPTFLISSIVFFIFNILLDPSTLARISEIFPTTLANLFLLFVSLAAGLVLWLGVSPLIVATIHRFASNEKPKMSFMQAIDSKATRIFFIQSLKLYAIIVAISIAAYIPYIISAQMIAAGSISNIFGAFSSILFLLGSLISIFVSIRFVYGFLSAGQGITVNLAEAFEKTKGRFFSIIFINVISIAPVYFITLILYGLLGFVVEVFQGSFIFYLIEYLRSIVISIGFLISLYLVWGALTEYMLKTKKSTAKKTK